MKENIKQQQLFVVPCQENVEVGQFITHNNDDTIVGFVVMVEGSSATIALFEPTPVTDDARVLAESLTVAELRIIIARTMEQNSDMRERLQKLMEAAVPNPEKGTSND